MRNIKLPHSLEHSYFFSEQDVELDFSQLQLWNSNAVECFLYEIAYSVEMNSYRPWENGEIVIPQLIEEWKALRCELDELYQKRLAKKAAPLMKKGIARCVSILFWMNEKPVILKDVLIEVDRLEFRPVNVTERLEFILSRPHLYQSYKVLEQIMVELEKLLVRSQISKKRQKKSSQQ
ncbi:MAG: YpoC family protein [Bacillus sp. (in: firmicutes)]